MRRTARWLACLPMALTCVAAAQGTPTSRAGLRLESTSTAPQAVVDSFFAAVDQERWADAARRLDMDQFTVYFNQTVGSVRAQLPAPKMTVETLMAGDSTMTRAVAEWQMGRMRQSIDTEPFGYLARQFARVRTQGELFALTPAEGAALDRLCPRSETEGTGNERVDIEGDANPNRDRRAPDASRLAHQAAIQLALGQQLHDQQAIRRLLISWPAPDRSGE